jgi:hypothetical protein
MTLSRMLPLLVVWGCTPADEDKDTGDELVVEDTGEHIERPESCVEEVRVDGVPVVELSDPRVGDRWYALLYCDDALQVGAYTLQADPPSLVEVDSEEPILEFVASGTAEVEYRMGSRRASFVVNIVD